MVDNEYISRVIDKKIEAYLMTFKAVSIEGPKWCGKTKTSMQFAKSVYNLGDYHDNFAALRMAKLDISQALKGETPHLIDEWQELPWIWDAVRYEADSAREYGRYILTGSSVPVRKNIDDINGADSEDSEKYIMHSGAGRFGRLRMRPMTLSESKESSDSVSLSGLFSGKFENHINKALSLDELAKILVRGGWPETVVNPVEDVSLVSKAYIDAVLKDDALRVGIQIRDMSKLEILLKSLARNESTTAKNSVIISDMETTFSERIDNDTLIKYLDLLSRMYLIDDIPPFSPSVRSSLRFKKSNKRHLADPSLSLALLGYTPEMLMRDLETFGFMFEALAERDLRVYGESIGASIYHYQDYNNREIDAVLQLPDGRWGAFEIKLGQNSEDEAAASMLRINNAIKENGGKPADLLCVITGISGMAYRRADGVYSIPINALCP